MNLYYSKWRRWGSFLSPLLDHYLQTVDSSLHLILLERMQLYKTKMMTIKTTNVMTAATPISQEFELPCSTSETSMKRKVNQ